MDKARQCPSCGGRKMTREENRSETIRYGGESITLSGLAGWFCPECHDGVFDDESSARHAAAGDELILRARQKSRKEVRRIRKKLGLTQKEAAVIFGGGVNAFSRYERGEVEPNAAIRHLLRLLDAHPDLLEEIRGKAA